MATQLAEQDAGEEVANDTEVQERDYETEARTQGWRPETEFKGKPELWVDAETFVKRADEIMPLVKAQNAQLKQQMAEMKRQIGKLQKSEQSAFENARAQIQRELDEAAEAGDVEGNRKAANKLAKLESEVSDTLGGEDPEEQIESFYDNNPWYLRGDKPGATQAEVDARIFADRLSTRLIRQGYDKEVAPSVFFTRVAEETSAKFPDLSAPKPAKPRPASDVAGVTRPVPRGSAKTGANLPTDAKETVRRYMRQGIYKGSFEEACNAFAKDYDWS